MGPRLPIKTASRVFLAGAALLLLGACATTQVEPETGGPGQKASSAQVLSICEKLARSKDTRLAIGLCEKAHMEDQQNPVPLLLLGDMLQQQGALAQAGRAYGMAIDLDPENVEAHYGLGKVFLARNQFDLAIEQFEVARELNTRDHRLYNALGVVLDNLGEHVAAQAHYKIGLELAPDNHALRKNLMLSRRLDSSVTTPAIGPRHKVVPRPLSPQSQPDEAQPGVVPPAPTPASPGRLGHEPLAQLPVPVEVQVRESFAAAAVTPAPRTPVLQTPAAILVENTREAPRSSRTAAPEAAEVEPKAELGASQKKTAAIAPKSRLIPLPPRAKPPVPAAVVAALPAREEPETNLPAARSLPKAAPPPSDAKVTSAAPLKRAAPASAATARVSSSYDEIPLPAAQVAAAPAVKTPRAPLSRLAEQGPEILASGFDRGSVVVEALPLLKQEPQVRQMAQVAVGELSVGAVETLAAHTPDPVAAEAEAESLVEDLSETLENRFASERTLEPNGAAGRIVKTALASDTPMAPDAKSPLHGDRSAPEARSSQPARVIEAAADPEPLSLVSDSPRQTARLRSGDDVIAGDDLQAETGLPAEAREESPDRTFHLRQRFGREHEEHHETRRVKGEFWDLVDVVNPMQHIPVIATIYRDITDDEIKPAAKIAGGTLFGGVLGFASSLVDSMIEEASGQDIGETALAAVAAPEPGRETGQQATLAGGQRFAEFDIAEARGR